MKEPIEVRMEVKLLTTGEPSSWVLQRFLAQKYHRFALDLPSFGMKHDETN